MDTCTFYFVKTGKYIKSVCKKKIHVIEYADAGVQAINSLKMRKKRSNNFQRKLILSFVHYLKNLFIS